MVDKPEALIRKETKTRAELVKAVHSTLEAIARTEETLETNEAKAAHKAGKPLPPQTSVILFKLASLYRQAAVEGEKITPDSVREITPERIRDLAEKTKPLGSGKPPLTRHELANYLEQMFEWDGNKVKTTREEYRQVIKELEMLMDGSHPAAQKSFRTQKTKDNVQKELDHFFRAIEGAVEIAYGKNKDSAQAHMLDLAQTITNTATEKTWDGELMLPGLPAEVQKPKTPPGQRPR